MFVLLLQFSNLFDIFFFKQKTAYEMRISDWSSDVCSSDLVAHAGVAHGAAQHRAAFRILGDLAVDHVELADHRLQLGARDRKSVVEGKSVSVRVDLGGRRIIKKKTIEKANNTGNGNN